MERLKEMMSVLRLPAPFAKYRATFVFSTDLGTFSEQQMLWAPILSDPIHTSLLMQLCHQIVHCILWWEGALQEVTSE